MEDCGVQGNFLFEPTLSLINENCFLAVQIVTVSSGLCGLNVEHRGAGPAVKLDAGREMGEIWPVTPMVTMCQERDRCALPSWVSKWDTAW